MKKNAFVTNERGYVFIVTLLLITLISVIGFGLMTITKNTLKVTTHEQADQSVYYIAEADLNVKRADINAELEAIFQPFLEKYNKDDKFDINKAFLSAAESYMDNKLTLPTQGTQTKPEKVYATLENYKKQRGLQPSSTVTLIKDDEPYTYILKSTAMIDNVSRTISQKFSLNTPNLIPGQPIPGEPASSYNFCFGMLANSVTTTNTYTTDADVVSLTDLKITNTGTFKNIYSKGSIEITNTATIDGDVIALKDFTITNGATFNKDIIVGGNITANGGSPKSSGNIFSMGNINLKVGFNTLKADGFVYADKNFINEHGSEISGVLFGKESIKDLTNWATDLGKKRYSMGDIVYINGDSTKNFKAANEKEFSEYLINEKINFNDYLSKIKNLSSAPGNSNNIDQCGTHSLANAQIPQAPPFLNVDSSSFVEIPDIALSWNTPSAISLTDNSYINNVSLVENRTLTIDVGDQDRTLVIDNLNGGGGHIKVIGKGKLNILVRNKLELLKFVSSSERTPFDTTIYYEGSNELKITETIQSNLYTKNSTVSIHNAGEGGMLGNLIVGGDQTVSITGNTTFGTNNHHVVLLVPKATIKLGGSAYINGTIVADNVDGVNAHTTHKFDKSKLNLDIFSPPKTPGYSTEGGFIDPGPPKEL